MNTRSGNFRPRSLPPPYQRGYSDEVQALLPGLLGAGRSINVAKTALRKMGLGSCSEELDSVASGLVEELELVNSRPVDPDLLAIFLDGKYVKVKDVDRLRPACVYLVVAVFTATGRRKSWDASLDTDAKTSRNGKPSFRSLIERGLRCVMIVVHDDFSGLLGPAMTSQSLARLSARLGILAHPFSEAQFKTRKYRPEFPDRFGSYEHALSVCRELFHWYNHEHHHGSIALMTPVVVHYGHAPRLFDHRR